MSKADKLKAEYAGKVSSDVYFDGNYTVAVIQSEKGRRAIGVAKRNPTSDVYVKERGVEIAMSRALENLDKQLHPRRYTKAK